MAGGESVKLILELQDELSGPLSAVSQTVNSTLSGMVAGARGMAGGLGSAVEAVTNGFASSSSGVMSFARNLGTSFMQASNIVGTAAKGVIGWFKEMESQSKWASAFIGAAIGKFAGELIEMAGKFERFGLSAQFMLRGTKESADDFAKGVRDISKETMFNVDQIADMLSRLVGNTKNVSQSTATLRSLSDAVAATGGSYGELEGATRAWVQINSKAKVSSEELNRQFANANIPVVRLLAESIERDANHPLRKYLEAAGNASGASKTLTKSFQDASGKLPLLSTRLDIAKGNYERLVKAAGVTPGTEGYDRWIASHEKSSLAVERAQASLMSAQSAYEKANGTISKYSETVKGAGKATSGAKLTVEQIMAQLQMVGNLNIPGTIGAEAVTRALNEAYGGANQQLLKSFDGQVSLLGDTLKLTALSFMGLDQNFRVVKGGLLDTLKNALAPILEFLNSHQEDFTRFAGSIVKSTPAISTLAGMILGILRPALSMLIMPLLLLSAKGAIMGFVIGKIVEAMGGWDNVIRLIKQAMDILIPAVSKVITFFSQLFTFIVTHKPILYGVIAAFALLGIMLLVQFIGPVIAVIGVIGSFIGALGFVIGWMVAVGAAVAAVVALWPILVNVITVVVQAIVNFFTVVLPNAINTLLTAIGNFFINVLKWFAELPGKVGAFMYKLFFYDIPYIIGYFIGWVTVQLPLLLANVYQWFIQAGINLVTEISSWPSRFETWLINLFNTVTTWFTNTKDSAIKLIGTTAKNIMTEISSWPGKIYDFLKSLPDIIHEILSAMKNVWSDMLNGIANIVSNWKDSVVGFFRGVWEAAERAIDTVKRAFTLGVGAGKSGSTPHFAHGGIVPGDLGQPVPIIAHGGERVIPYNGLDVNRGSNASSINITFTGPVSLDSDERVNELAQRIIRMIGRQSELARYGGGY